MNFLRALSPFCFGHAADRFSRKPAFKTALLMIVCALSCIGCDQPWTAPSEMERGSAASTKTVNVMRVSMQDQYNEVATYYGTLKPRQSASLAFTRGGKIKRVIKGLGEKVAAGDIIAQFDIEGLDQRQPAINDASLIAPFSGTIARADVEVGQVASAGRPLVDVVSDGPPIIEVSISSATAQAQFVGRRLNVVLDGNQAAEAVIKAIAPVVDPSTRTRKVLLDVVADPEQPSATFGSIVEISFDSFRSSNGCWLPLSAIQKRASGLWSTMVAESNNNRTIAVARTIEVVHVESAMAFVRGALKEGDLIVVDGTHRIVPGQAVIAKIEPASSEPIASPAGGLEASNP